MKPLALYIHVPFCMKKCYYCDFLSFAETAEEVQVRYFDALMKEIAEATSALVKAQADPYEVSSIYFGGGTPSYPNEKHIRRILNHIYDHFQVRMDAEITLEVNPGTVDGDKLRAYQEMGINRLSIGAQSMMNLDLEHLGRAHNVSQFYEAYRNARTAGFRNISVDIMMGLPGQTSQEYLNTLREVAACHPEHISSYSLTVEEGTPYYDIYGKGRIPLLDNMIGLAKLPLPDEETERAMYEQTNHYLMSAGYHRYEISNFAKNDPLHPGRYESRHNTVYWTRGEYLGLGLGASSMIQNQRISNVRSLEAYLKAEGDLKQIRLSTEEIDLNAQVEEFMFLGLRMMRGVSLDKFQRTFHVPMEEVYGGVMEFLQAEGLLQVQDGYAALTSRGIDISNRVLSYFLFDREEAGETSV